MNDKKDGPGKGPERAASDNGAAKRPFATIDLKATEVPGAAAGTTAAATGTSGQTAAAEKIVAAAQAGKSAAANAASAMAAAAASSAAKGSAGAAESKAQTPDTGGRFSGSDSIPRTAAAAAARPTVPPVAPRSGSSFGRFLSHMAAGIAGGLLALLGLQHIGPWLGIDGGQTPPSVVGGLAPDHAARLNVLEKQVRERLAAPAAPDGGRGTAAIESSLARVDEMTKQLAAIGEMQTKLATDQSTLRDEFAKRPPAAGQQGTGGDAMSERLAKLEEQISSMANAAAANPQAAGRLPQLAQLTGQVADLKSALDTRLAAQRKDLVQEIETRVGPGTEAAEAAKAGAKRIDGEVAGIKTEAARMTQRLDQLKAGSDKLEQTLKSLQDETQGLKTALEGVKTNVAEQFKSAAKPTDIALAVTPLATKLTSLESSVQSVMKAEEDRKSNAERIVLSLELGNLKRAMDRGQKYAPELAEVKKVAGNRVDTASLEKFQNVGVPPVAELSRSFRTIANAVIDADAQPADGTIVDRLLSGAKSVVRVRKTSHGPNDSSAEAVVARMETALKEQRLGDVMTEAQKLSAKAAAPAQDWLKQVDARRTVDVALAAIDEALKTSLGAGPAGQKGTKQ